MRKVLIRVGSRRRRHDNSLILLTLEGSCFGADLQAFSPKRHDGSKSLAILRDREAAECGNPADTTTTYRCDPVHKRLRLAMLASSADFDSSVRWVT